MSGEGPGAGGPEVVEAEVLAAETVGGPAHAPYCRLVLRAPGVAEAARPGQFVHVFCPGRPAPPAAPGVPFLRRPLSVHDADPGAGTISLLFRVSGPGTASLALARVGAVVDLVGPLGEGTFPLDGTGPRPPVLVGGGIGVAPLLLLARSLAARGPVSVLVGVAGAGDLGLARLFEGLPGVELSVATEDGTPGTFPGLVTGLLERELGRGFPDEGPGPGRDRPGATGEPAGGSRGRTVYACGPRPMLAAVWRLGRAAGARTWVSVEERMACGVGACRGCATRVLAGPGELPYRLVCRHGPVFDAAVLDWGGNGGAL